MAEENSTGTNFTPSYQTDKESIRISHDFKIEYVKLFPWNGSPPIDLTNVRETINIFEDIFNGFIT
jgi:hypothetical protein